MDFYLSSSWCRGTSSNRAIRCNSMAGQVSSLRYESTLRDMLWKEKNNDWGADKPVISENVREEDVIAALISVIILCNMVFVNSAVMRLPRAVVESDCCWDYQHILCNTRGWCISAQGQVLFPFGDLSLCFPSNGRLKKRFISVKCESEVWLPVHSCCVGGLVESFKDFSLIMKGVLESCVYFLLSEMGQWKKKSC